MAKRQVITIQTVDEALWQKVTGFLETHRRIPSLSALAKVSLENYLELANRYGIDSDWKLKIPRSDVVHDANQEG